MKKLKVPVLLSGPILKQSVRNNWKMWVGMTALICLVAVAMAAIKLPPRAQAMSIAGVIGNSLFQGPGMFIFMIFCAVVGNKLVASEIDKGYMSFTLNTPTTRAQVILSKALFYLTAILTMTLVMCVVATIAFAAFHTKVSLGTFWAMAGAFLVFVFAISGICFAASCWFNKSGHSLLVGVGVPFGFYLLSTLSGVVDQLKFLKYASINTLLDIDGIVSGAFVPWELGLKLAALFAIGLGLYIFGIVKYLKKDLPL